MANYSYDESGNMAAYFVITFLSIFLIPYTLSPLFSTSSAFPCGSPARQLITPSQSRNPSLAANASSAPPSANVPASGSKALSSLQSSGDGMNHHNRVPPPLPNPTRLPEPL